MKLTGAQIVIETLLEQGVDTVFGFPGATVIDIYDKLYDRSNEIKHVLAAHEQGAAHMADGYARSTGNQTRTLVQVCGGPDAVIASGPIPFFLTSRV